MRQIIDGQVWKDICSLSPEKLKEKYKFTETVPVTQKYPNGLVVIADEPRDTGKANPFDQLKATSVSGQESSESDEDMLESNA